ncbi:MAG: thioesterase family protein [Halolamina sp.]
MTFETTIGVRYRDIDAMGHVNNAVYASYLEQARIDYFHDLLGVDLSAIGAVLASLSVDYKQPIELQDGPVRVELDVPRIGDSSIPMEYELYRDDDALAATGETVQVAFDKEAQQSTSIPAPWREAITEFHDL